MIVVTICMLLLCLLWLIICYVKVPSAVFLDISCVVFAVSGCRLKGQSSSSKTQEVNEANANAPEETTFQLEAQRTTMDQWPSMQLHQRSGYNPLLWIINHFLTSSLRNQFRGAFPIPCMFPSHLSSLFDMDWRRRSHNSIIIGRQPFHCHWLLLVAVGEVVDVSVVAIPGRRTLELLSSVPFCF